MPDWLRGKRIVLAGGSGGLGAATAELLAGEGARLVVSYRADATRAGALASIAELVQADLTLPADRRRLLDAAPDLYGLAIFAGEPARVADPAMLEETLRHSLEVNCLGPLLLAREAAARMRPGRSCCWARCRPSRCSRARRRTPFPRRRWCTGRASWRRNAGASA